MESDTWANCQERLQTGLMVLRPWCLSCGSLGKTKDTKDQNVRKLRQEWQCLDLARSRFDLAPASVRVPRSEPLHGKWDKCPCQDPENG